MKRAKSSYKTELSALVKGLMIIPASWDVEWVSDSESSIKTLERGEQLETASNENEWQLKQLLARIIQARTGNLEATHQKSHKKLRTKNSIGNATADVLADSFTSKETQQENTAELPMGYNNRRWMLQDTKDYEWITVPIRRKLRNDREEKIDAQWKGAGTQNKVKNENGSITTLLKRFKRTHKGQNKAMLTRLITGVHNQKPHFEGRFKKENNCEFCKQKGKGDHENTAEHEAECKHDEEKHKENLQECNETAKKEAELGDEKNTRERPTEEQIMERNELMQTLQLQEENGTIYLGHGEDRMKAPTQKLLTRTTDNFVRHSKKEYKTGANLLQTIRETFRPRGKHTEPAANQKTWRMIQAATRSDIQIGRNPENQSEEIPTFHRIGGGAQLQKDGVRLVATITEPDLEQYLKEVELRMTEDPRIWSTTITRRTEKTTQTLEQKGYTKIATWGLNTRKTTDVHVKIGSKGRQTTKKTLIGLEELGKWDDTVRKTTDKEAYIDATANEPWPQDQTPTKRTELITESMNWLKGTMATRGIETPAHIKFMTDRGISEKTAKRIVRKCTNRMFQAYVEDTKAKYRHCEKKLKKEKWEQQKQRVKKMQKEREQAKAEKERKKADLQEAKQLKAKKKKEQREEKQKQKEQRNKEKREEKQKQKELNTNRSKGKERKQGKKKPKPRKNLTNKKDEQREQTERRNREKQEQTETRNKGREERRNERRRKHMQGETGERERIRNTG
jgi:hypothetical protein